MSLGVNVIDEELLSILVCPADRGPLVLVDDANDRLLYNPRLHRAYRIEDNIPVLLVDDMVDSRWTLTAASYLLSVGGSGPIYPLALASTASSDE